MMRLLLILMALLVSLPVFAAQEKHVQTMLGALDLPFSVEPVSSLEGVYTSYGVRNDQSLKFTIADGPLAGQKLEIVASYFSPDRTDSGLVQAWLRSLAEKIAKEPGTRKVEPYALNGFGFYFIDQMTGDSEDDKKQPVADADIRRSVELRGVINGAWVTLAVILPKTATDDYKLEPLLKGFVLDYAAMLKLGSRLTDEATLVIHEKRLDTPLGTLEAPAGMTIRLSGSMVRLDAAGKPTARSLKFQIAKAGFWMGPEQESLNLQCDRLAGSDPVIRADLDKVDLARYTTLPGGGSATYGGLVGATTLVRSTDTSPQTGTRWLSISDGTAYVWSSFRFGNKNVDTDIAKLMTGMKFACATDIGSLDETARADLGLPTVTTTSAPPPTPAKP